MIIFSIYWSFLIFIRLKNISCEGRGWDGMSTNRADLLCPLLCRSQKLGSKFPSFCNKFNLIAAKPNFFVLWVFCTPGFLEIKVDCKTQGQSIFMNSESTYNIKFQFFSFSEEIKSILFHIIYLLYLIEMQTSRNFLHEKVARFARSCILRHLAALKCSRIFQILPDFLSRLPDTFRTYLKNIRNIRISEGEKN